MTNLIRYYIPICVQLLIASIVAVVLVAVKHQGLAAWLNGSLLAIVCNGWFIFRAVASNKVRASEWVVALASRGILEKYIIAASGFIYIFVIVKPSAPLLVFVSFSLMIVVQWVVNFKMKDPAHV